MGLRDTKQKNQRISIIENAIALFRERDFDAVPVREIALACTLSEATFFNYFGDKAGVLREWAKREFDASLAVAVEAARGGPLRRVVRLWAAELARRAAADPILMRKAWLHVRVSDFTGAPSRARGRAPGPEPVLPLIESAQRESDLRADLDADLLAQLLLSCLAGTLSTCLAESHSPTEKSVAERLGRGADLLLDGFRKRNERVPAPSAGLTPAGSK
jgi:AcrR family transcriptional regulator